MNFDTVFSFTSVVLPLYFLKNDERDESFGQEQAIVPGWSAGFGRYLSLGNVWILLGVKFVFYGVLCDETSSKVVRWRITVCL